MSRASATGQPRTFKSPKSSITCVVDDSKLDTSSLDKSALSQQDMLVVAEEFSRLDHFAHKTYRNCHHAGEDYWDIAHEVHRLHNVLRVMRDQKDDLESSDIRKDPTLINALNASGRRVKQLFEELDIMIEKFDEKGEDVETMSAARKKIWNRLKDGSKNAELAIIKFKLVSYTSDIADILKTRRISTTSRSRPHSRLRRSDRPRSDSEDMRLEKVPSRTSPRGSATSTPRSSSPSEQPISDAKKMQRANHSDLSNGGRAVNGRDLSALLESPKLLKERQEPSKRRRRRRSLSLLDEPSNSEIVDWPKRRDKLKKSTMPSTSELDLPHQRSRLSKASKSASPTDDGASAEEKEGAPSSKSEPASPLINALNLDYFRRTSYPPPSNYRVGSKRDPPFRSNRMSLHLDDVKEVPETNLPTSKLTPMTLATPLAEENPPSETDAKISAPVAKPTPTSEKSAESSDGTITRISSKGSTKPVLARTNSGRPVVDPMKAQLMDNPQLKALRAEANTPDAICKNSFLESIPISITTTSGSSSPASSPRAEYIRASALSKVTSASSLPSKSIKGSQSTHKHRSKVSWYKTLNTVRSLRNLKQALAPTVCSKGLKSILKGPANLKKDPGALENDGNANNAAQYTKISRKILCPEALELGHEKFQIRHDSIIVLRVLSRQEIEGYASRSMDIREQRHSHHSDVDSDGETKMVNDVVSSLASLATMFLQKKTHGA